MNLTPHQRDLMLFIQRYVDRRRCSPSFEEMTIASGLASKSGVHRMICALEERGFIARMHGRQRALSILKRIPDPDAPPVNDEARDAYKRALQEIAAGDGIYGHQAWEYKAKARAALKRFP